MKGAALITGGAKRVGKAIALTLAKAGYDIALHYHTSEIQAEETAAEIRGLGVSCTIFQSPLSGQIDAYQLLTQASHAYTHLNVLINNAAIFEHSVFLETDEALLEHHFATNFKAPFFLTQAFAKDERKGCVVNMLDTFITKQSHGYFTYLQSKKALHAFTISAAKELAPAIRVNGVAPGVVLPSADHDENYLKHKATQNPTGRIATVEEIANAVLALVSSPTKTGEIIFVDGGESTI